MQELSVQIVAEDEGRMVRQIALSRLSMSYGQFKRAKFQGEVLLDDEPVFADHRVRCGQQLVIRLPETARGEIVPWAVPLAVAYEDADILVVDKPAPLASVPSPRQQQMTLQNAVFSYLGCPKNFQYRPVNRLDKGTSGLMAIALHAHAQQYLQRRLHSDVYVREYLAVCDGVPPEAEGTIDAPIGKADGASIRRIITPAGKPACTDYRVERTGGGRSLLRLRLQTGRTHQIRVHMQALGCPVTGDFLYGQEHSLLPRRFALHSEYLSLETINGKVLSLQSSLPEVFENLLTDQP